MNSILIESNRIIADSQLQKGVKEEQSQTTDNHETLDNNASWNTTIDTGIELNAGDTIQMEAAALNINGAGSGNFQQFNGKVDIPDPDGIFRKDNAMDIEIVYYTTNNCQFNYPLPSARHMIELNDVFQGDYGGPSFSGRFLWRPRPKNFNTHLGASSLLINASVCWDWGTPNYGEGGLGSDPAYTRIGHKWIMNQCSYLNGPATNNQCYGGYFFNGMNTDIPVPLSTSTAATQKEYSQGLADCAAYTCWGSLIPWTNMPGVQFGADLGGTSFEYPDEYAVGYDQGTPPGTADVRLPYSNNLNVEIKSRFTSEGYFPSGQNGGTAPQLLRGALNEAKPVVAVSIPAGSYSNGNYPQDWYDYNNKGPHFYFYEMHDEPAMFKGSVYNNKPNSNKHYHPQKDDPLYYCRGPYYNNQSNTLIQPTAVGDANMDGLQNMHTYSRGAGWWRFQTKRINIELQTGNIAPSRVSEIITDAMKVHDGNADDPQTTFIKQETYTPDEISLRDGFAGNLIATEQAGISGKSFATVETIAGSCLSSAQNPDLTGTEYGWDAVNTDNLPLLVGETDPKGVGADFNVNQAKMQYWSNMLSGNPFEWGCMTYCLPMCQYRPFIDEDVNDPAIWKGYKYWSIYTGEYKINSGANSFETIFNKRLRVDGTHSHINIGEYSDNPIIMETPRKKKSLKKSVPYRGLWNIQSCVSNAQGGTQLPPGQPPKLTGPYRIQSYPYGIWDIDPPHIQVNPGEDPVRGQLGHAPTFYNLFAPATPTSQLNPSNNGEFDLILTNIVFDGQMTLKEIDKQMRGIEGHEIASGNDSLLSQSNEFFNNTWVKWKMGRLNDQMTHPDQYIDDYLTRDKAYEGQKGVAQYLPNIYQTMQLYSDHTDTPKPKKAYEAGLRGNINDILTNASAQPHYADPDIQGSYSMCPLKMGIYEGANAGGVTNYNNNFNPDLYPCPENGPPQYPNNTTPIIPGQQGGGFGQPPSTAQTQDTWRYGPPCWGFFKREMTENYDGKSLGENETGFNKIGDRSFKAFRYLPQGQPSQLAYNAINAWNETIYTGLSDEWTTKPANMPYTEFEEIWEQLINLNDGRGCGVIPVFHRKNKSITFNNIPFLAIIYQSHEYLDMPTPEKGEHIMLGTSPSLTQNDLSFPATTQQRFDTHFESGWQGNQQQGNMAADRQPSANVILNKIRATGTPSINAPSMYVGTNDPVWSFDNTYNRYAYSKFHTNFFKGNGVYQYGNAGASADPETPEVIVKGQMSAFSKSLTLPNSCTMLANNTDTDPHYLEYAENIQHNWIWDESSPGGWFSDTIGGVPVNHTSNKQYGSPDTSTQWELKFMPNSGFQKRNIPNIDGITTPALCNGPPQENKFGLNFQIPDNIIPYAFIKQAIKKYPTISAQSGVGILSLSIPRIDGKVLNISKTDYKLFKGSLFYKMGFVLNQFLPLFYQVQTQLDHILFNKYATANAPAGEAYHNCPYPVSTQALISTSLTPALSSGFGVEVHDPPITSPINTQYPFYKLGMLIPAGRTNAISESVFALNLPQKLNFPYLVCRTNIMTPTSLQYYGGANGRQILPAIAYLMTNYATNDFFYIQKSDLIFTVNRAYTLTEIRTSIHLPNGELADKILDGNSAVIYRINKAPPPDPKTAEADKKFHDELLGIDPKGPEI